MLSPVAAPDLRRIQEAERTVEDLSYIIWNVAPSYTHVFQDDSIGLIHYSEYNGRACAQTLDLSNVVQLLVSPQQTGTDTSHAGSSVAAASARILTALGLDDLSSLVPGERTLARLLATSDAFRNIQFIDEEEWNREYLWQSFIPFSSSHPCGRT